ncbi:MAG: rhomboid family intramembrane serine protease [Bacteroidales bacterium]|nr:rhomboid family intramembrane serine protease [Bacteroidales bacterium]
MKYKENIEIKRFWIAVFFPAIYVFIIWFVYFLEIVFEVDFSHYGVYPQKLKGLIGILFSPLIHGSWEHLVSNSIPLLVLGTMLFYFYPKSSWKVFLLLYFITSLWVWVGARQAYHIGASGIIYGLAAFIFTSGVLLKSISLLAISLLVVFLYGSMVWGIFPIQWKYSWESHLSGFVLGVILAVYFRKENTYQEILPDWMSENDDDSETDINDIEKE